MNCQGLLYLILLFPWRYCTYHHHQIPQYHGDYHQEIQNFHDDVGSQMGYPTGPPPSESYQMDHQHHPNYEIPPESHHPSPSAASCLSRIRLAASFDPQISTKINRFIDSMRIDRLRAYVCERTAYFCDEAQQKGVGDLFHQFDRSIEIIDRVKGQLTTTEKDQLNMMENLNDTLAEQTFFVYKFHQLNPVDLAVLTSAKTSLTTALSSSTPDAALSKAMGSFSPQDLEKLATFPVAHLPEEVRSHLARCQITAPEVVHDTVAFLLSVIGSKHNN
ncbi:Protein CBG15743 [Caenorhabditis briggsae]|uniref:Protein CBG15743 n=2 Tax=Caenorhabditis briggsae TaxID=6238 RepID=A8XMP2_CAEBR|nr:Protein CBG15743 [Caenorhabditis briggsae]CAP33918.2 Protein CBG15743 [Caenorhabditis briggsae]